MPHLLVDVCTYYVDLEIWIVEAAKSLIYYSKSLFALFKSVYMAVTSGVEPAGE